jgi:hypothetical protein
MFGFGKQAKTNKRPPNVRARDGQVRLTGSQVRARRKHSGLTGKQTRRVVNDHRRHRKGL